MGKLPPAFGRGAYLSPSSAPVRRSHHRKSAHHHRHVVRPSDPIELAILRADPINGRLMVKAFSTHLVPGVVRSYSSIVRSYEEFCMSRSIVPWPTCCFRMSAWLIRISTHVKFTSMRMYLSAIRDCQLTMGLPWLLKGDERLRRTLRWIKRRFPCSPVGLKFAISLKVLRRILPLLPSWGSPALMSHDDRVFAIASICGTCCMLRGGEFLSSKGSSRQILKCSDVSVRLLRLARALVVSVPQPKARWWLNRVDVPCFEQIDLPEFSAVSLWESYFRLSPAITSGPEGSTAGLPAFHFSDGSPVSRDWMLKRTAALCEQAGISMVGRDGKVHPLKMASWRAGGVRSAKDGGLSDSMIMFLGRWSSNAWRAYLLHTAIDVQGAVQRMWQGSEGAGQPHGFLEAALQSVEDKACVDETVAMARASASKAITPALLAKMRVLIS